jgi:hypothetical protein
LHIASRFVHNHDDVMAAVQAGLTAIGPAYEKKSHSSLDPKRTACDLHGSFPIHR